MILVDWAVFLAANTLDLGVGGGIFMFCQSTSLRLYNVLFDGHSAISMA